MSVPLNAERLIECREKNGLNKLEAARKMGLSQSGYVRYESGERKPTIQVVEAMAQALKTSADYLLGRTDDPEPDHITIYKADEPILFELTKDLTQMKTDQQRRVMVYLEKMKSQLDKKEE